MRVSNLKSPRSGAPVANQYEIVDGDRYIFQSYQTVIAAKEGRHYTISADYNYSRTTSKYFTSWLQGWGWHRSEISDLYKWLKKHQPGDKSMGDTFNGIGGELYIKYVEAL